jgi:hypothetical protein
MSEEDNVSESNSYSSQMDDSVVFAQTKSISWLDNAKIRYGGRYDDNQVEDVKSLKNIIILFAILIPYWMVYYQVR